RTRSGRIQDGIESAPSLFAILWHDADLRWVLDGASIDEDNPGHSLRVLLCIEHRHPGTERITSESQRCVSPWNCIEHLLQCGEQRSQTQHTSNGVALAMACKVRDH